MTNRKKRNPFFLLIHHFKHYSCFAKGYLNTNTDVKRRSLQGKERGLPHWIGLRKDIEGNSKPDATGALPAARKAINPFLHDLVNMKITFHVRWIPQTVNFYSTMSIFLVLHKQSALKTEREDS
jgi:hypothetical protein